MMVDDEKIPLDSLTQTQTYYYTQMIELQSRIDEAKRNLDILQVAYKGFEDMMFKSLKGDVEPK